VLLQRCRAVWNWRLTSAGERWHHATLSGFKRAYLPTMGIVWQGIDESPPECVAALKAVLSPVLEDVTATASLVELVIDPRPRRGCGCVLLPPGRSYPEVTRRAPTDDDGPFPMYRDIEISPRRARGISIALAAGDVQQFVIASIWTKTGIGGWPICPVHKSHPLWPYPSSETAVWKCERSDFQVEIGDLRHQ